jgi:hypothetical protein
MLIRQPSTTMNEFGFGSQISANVFIPRISISIQLSTFKLEFYKESTYIHILSLLCQKAKERDQEAWPSLPLFFFDKQLRIMANPS